MVDITFKGQFNFSDKQSLKDTLNDIKELIKDEDESVFITWKDSHKINELSIIIDINIGCAQDDFWAYEGIIETLADNATTGKVEGWRDDYPEGEKEIYEAGAENLECD